MIHNIFVNDISCRSEGGNITSSISDHFCQFTLLDIFQHEPSKKINKLKRDFRNFSKREFYDELSNIDWSDVTDEQLGTNQCYDNFLYKIDHLLDEMAPFRKMTIKQIKLEQRPWITKGILTSMRVRDKLQVLSRKTVNIREKTVFLDKYKFYRNLIVSLLRKSKQNYFQLYFHQYYNNSRKTWEGIRNLVNVTKHTSNLPSKLVYKSNVKTTKKEKSQAFNDFFVNIGSSIDEKIPNSNEHFSAYLRDPIEQSIFLSPCSENELRTIIRNMSTSKASGPFSIPINLLVEFLDVLIEPLNFVINLSLKEGTFPTLCKDAYVCPIYKKNDRTRCENYRPISLLPNMSKIFERVMYNRLNDFLVQHDVIYQFQFGFQKKLSTTHALLSITEEIRKLLDKKLFACGVFVDLEKAFDTVNHQILISKLDHYGIRGIANTWLKSYLYNRHQCVKYEDVISERMPINCGVPQGSILGPLLFLLYINDRNKALTFSTTYHFADDTNLLCSGKSMKHLRKAVNKDLKSLYSWRCANRLSLNVDKTEFVIFQSRRQNPRERITLKLNNKTIYESFKLKYLGLILDHQLNWKAQITELSKKLSRAVGLMYKIRHYCPDEVTRTIYFSIFNSHVSYGLPVWGICNQDDLKKIQTLQNQALRAMVKQDGNDLNINKIRFDKKILNIKDLFHDQLYSLMWDYDHDNLAPSLCKLFSKSNLVHDYSTRMAIRQKLHLGKISTVKYGNNSFSYIGAKTLNDLKNLDIYNNARNKSTFLKSLKQNLLSAYV